MRPILWPLVGIIFLITFFFSVSVSVPALNINDEWITVNQIHQLGAGHQIVFNEGKYGSFLSGEDTPYFIERNNILGYSLALPLISLPTLFIFKIFDQIFRLFVIFLASLSLILTSVLILKYYPQYSSLKGYRWPWMLVIIGFLSFIGNLIYFTPFIAKDPYPIEVAAVIFTEHLLFGLLAVILYLISRELFNDDWYALFSAFSLICCSSYLYWATTAKDHLLAVLIFSFVFLFFLSYLREQNIKSAAYSFICAGFLLWVRPELGLTTITGLFLYFLLLQIYDRNNGKCSSLLYTCGIIIISSFAGAVPFLLNNWIITKNPLIPIFTYYKEDIADSDNSWRELESGLKQGEYLNISPEPELFTPIHPLNPINTIIAHFTPYWDSLLHDFSLILLSPDSGMMGIIGLSPLFLMGIALLPIAWMISQSELHSYKKRTVGLCFVLITFVFITYIKSFPGLLISEGIGPDMRYLTPIYIPAGLLGLVSLYHGVLEPDWKKVFLRSILGCVVGAPAIILLLMIIQPLGGGFIEYTYTLSVCSVICAGLIIFLSLFTVYIQKGFKSGGLLIPLLPIFPFSWQLMMVLLFSITKFDGYPFWMPILEKMYELIIIPVG